VLDVMQSFLDASNGGRHVVLSSGVDRPAAMPKELKEGILDG
jgi:hypothetical protein